MPLTLNSIYKPINDFFLDRFDTDKGSPVFFKFDKTGASISDSEFIDPKAPQFGVSPALATEKFSDIVNSMPIEDSDGQNIYFSERNIDSFYHDELLSPAIPFVPSNVDEAVKESIVNTFIDIKAEAIRTWEMVVLTSSTGIIFTIKPALASPQDWYDHANTSIWSSHSFEAKETITSQPAVDPNLHLWRLKVNDVLLKSLLPIDNPEVIDIKKVHEEVFRHRATRLMDLKHLKRLEPTLMTTTAIATPVANEVKPRTAAARTRGFNHIPIGALTHIADVLPEKQKPQTFEISDKLKQSLVTLDLKQRIHINQFIKENAPTVPSTTSMVSVSFEYCLVKINRPWFSDSFINNKSWIIPGLAKGAVTAGNNGSISLKSLPIAFLAIKNLSISANWTQTDIEISKNATDFGPFEVSYDSETNKLKHAGIQIIGWMLESLPELPPNAIE